MYADNEARRRLLGEVDVYGQKSALLFFEEHEAYTKDCAPLFFRYPRSTPPNKILLLKKNLACTADCALLLGARKF